MGQPTNAVFERVGSKQLWLQNWVAAPAKFYYMASVQRDWLLHRLIILYLLYGVLIPRTHMWAYDVSKTRSLRWGRPASLRRWRSQRSLPNTKKAHIFARYYRSTRTQFITGDDSIKVGATVHNRKIRRSNVFYSRVTVLQCRMWTVIRWCFYKPANHPYRPLGTVFGLRRRTRSAKYPALINHSKDLRWNRLSRIASGPACYKRLRAPRLAGLWVSARRYRDAMRMLLVQNYGGESYTDERCQHRPWL